MATETKPKAERWPSRSKRCTVSELPGQPLEAAHELLILKGLITFVDALLDHVVAEELVIAEEIGGGLLVVVGGPGAVVVLKVGRGGVGEILGGEGCIAV